MATCTSSNSIGANLLSCGGVGFIRLWNVHTGKLVGEYQAHIDGISINQSILFK
jgi:WD40 repeat protein